MRKYLVSITVDSLDVGLAASVLSLLVIVAVLVGALLGKATSRYAVDSCSRSSAVCDTAQSTESAAVPSQ